MNPQTFLDNFAIIARAPDGVQRLRELILDLAVSGRLVGQDADDEPASQLLTAIETASMVTQSTLTEPIPANGSPWPVPASWTWARMKQVADFSPGRTPPTKDPTFWSDSEGYYWVAIGDMPPGGEVTSTSRHVTAKAASQIFKQEPDPPGTLLMSFKLTIGKVARLGVPAFHNEAIVSISTPFDVLSEFLFRTLPLLTQGGASKAAIMGHTLNKTSLTNLLIPVPPLAEQAKIVARVDELMRLCDGLELALSAQAAAASDLAGAATRSLAG